MRFAVYKLPRGQGGEAMRIRWHQLVLSQTEACNRDLPAPMRPARVVSTARSIARFTWTNPYFGRTDDMGRRDPAVQRERGLASGRARRERCGDGTPASWKCTMPDGASPTWPARKD